MNTNSVKPFSNNCPINERTGDGNLVGRCWSTLKKSGYFGPKKLFCPRHGDVTDAVKEYCETGNLTPEKRL